MSRVGGSDLLASGQLFIGASFGATPPCGSSSPSRVRLHVDVLRSPASATLRTSISFSRQPTRVARRSGSRASVPAQARVLSDIALGDDAEDVGSWRSLPFKLDTHQTARWAIRLYHADSFFNFGEVSDAARAHGEPTLGNGATLQTKDGARLGLIETVLRGSSGNSDTKIDATPTVAAHACPAQRRS